MILLALPVLAVAAEPSPDLIDLTGVGCQAHPRDDIASDPSAAPPEYLHCGGSLHPGGSVSAIGLPLSLPTEAEARHALLEKTAASAAAGRSASSRMTCREGTWTTVSSGVEFWLRPCTLNEGAWPAVQLVAALGHFLVQAEGLPSMLPVLAAVMARQAGTAAFIEPEEAKALLSAAFGTDAGLVGSGDHDRYQASVEKARLDNSRNDYRAAEEALRQALAIQERALGSAAVGVGSTLMSLALEVSNQGRFDESAALFRRADPIIQRSPNPGDQARYFSYMAFDTANAGRFSDALDYARTASATWRGLVETEAPNLEDLGGGERAHSALRGELAHSLNTQAAMAVRVGQLGEAEAVIKEALEILGEESGLPPWWRPEILTTAGEVYTRLGRFDDADQAFRGALVFQQRLFGATAPMAFSLLSLGAVHAAEHNDVEAVRAYGLAMDILAKDRSARAAIGFDQILPLLVSASALAKQQPVRRAELEAMMLRAVQLPAGGVADQTIAHASARLAAGTPAIAAAVEGWQEADRRRDAARIALSRETALPDGQRGADKEAALLAELNRQTEAAEAARQRLKAEFPAYFELAQGDPVELPVLQARLGPREALVLFGVGTESVFVICVTSERFSAHRLDLDLATLESRVRTLRQTIAVQAEGRLREFDLDEAHGFYRALFGPISQELARIDHLILVPGGALASLPMALLVTEPPAPGASRDYRHAAWLVRRFSSAQVPSIAAFVALRSRPHDVAAGRPFLGLGDPAFWGVAANRNLGLEQLARQCREDGPIPARELRSLAPLPDTAAEVRSVAQALGAGPDSILLGGAASESNLRAQPLSEFRVLYFATHGLLPGELSCQSEPALALSPPSAPATSRAEDGLLEASEIAGLTLNAELVVLSACNTALAGDRFGGEALAGLAESFFHAGARTVVASHWPVPSAATATLMTGMFRRLGADLSGGVAGSLRQSQLALIEREETAHPFHWAGFTVIGDGAEPPRPLSRTEGTSP